MDPDFAQGDPYQNQVGLPQGPQKSGDKSVLPLPRLRQYGGKLPGARWKQVLLEVRRREAPH